MSGAEQMQQFRSWLVERGLKVTRQREAIAGVFFASNAHLSLEELLELAKAQQPSVGYATVYRTMKILAECGLASEHKFGEGNVRYEPAVHGEHHDHLICVTCGKILEYEDARVEAFQEELAARYGLRVVSHRHEIYGECVRPGCPDRPAEAGRAGSGD